MAKGVGLTVLGGKLSINAAICPMRDDFIDAEALDLSVTEQMFPNHGFTGGGP
ncbi:hypothetical protein [Aminobacter sp. J44]|jgi:hypothetical protein|uniref:hypothetical protein n=1 Tax=Aminobacter sp. J44 TaxID=935262 RepID=UPI001AEED853|nr:hypothetical protein [Aminobacter sp. J44]